SLRSYWRHESLSLSSFPTRRSSDLTNFITSSEAEEDITPMISQVQDVLFNVFVSQEGQEFHSFAFKDDGCSVGLIHPDLVEFTRSEEHTSELQSRENLVCRLLLEKK